MAAQTGTKTRGKPDEIKQEKTGNLAVSHARLPYPIDLEEGYGVTEQRWRTLIDAIFPNATSVESVRLAIDYCKSRNLDIMKRPVHIVPMYSKALGRMVETVWPSITEIRITATRTNVYAGCDDAAFGPDIKKEWEIQYENEQRETLKRKVTLIHPEWCQITVYKIVSNMRCAFVGPRVYWDEIYARAERGSQMPNDIWMKRPHGQLEKCSEAASLRKAFPEELGDYYAPEEMEGRDLDRTDIPSVPIETPPRPTRPGAPQAAADAPKVTDAEHTEVSPSDAPKPATTAPKEEPSVDDAGRSDEGGTPIDCKIEPPVKGDGSGFKWGEWGDLMREAIAGAESAAHVNAIRVDNDEYFTQLGKRGAQGVGLRDEIKQLLAARGKALTTSEPKSADDFGDAKAAEKPKGNKHVQAADNIIADLTKARDVDELDKKMELHADMMAILAKQSQSDMMRIAGAAMQIRNQLGAAQTP